MELSKFAFQQNAIVASARDISCAPGACPGSINCIVHSGKYRRVLTHAQVVVRTPDRDFGSQMIMKSPGKRAGSAYEIGKHSIAIFCPQSLQACLKESLEVIHGLP